MIDVVSVVDYCAAVVASAAVAARLVTFTDQDSSAGVATSAIRHAVTIGTGCGTAALVMWAPATRDFGAYLADQPMLVDHLALALMMVAATAAICACWWTLLSVERARRRSAVHVGVLAGMLAALAVVAARATPDGELAYKGVGYAYFVLTYGWYGLVMMRALPAMRSVLRWAALWTIGSVACGSGAVIVQLSITMADAAHGQAVIGWSAPSIILGAIGTVFGSAGTSCTRWVPAVLELAYRWRARRVERALEPLWQLISQTDDRQLGESDCTWSADERLQRRVVQIHDAHRNAVSVTHPQLGGWVEAMAPACRWSSVEVRQISDAAMLVDVLHRDDGERSGASAWAGMPELAVKRSPMSLLRRRPQTRPVRRAAELRQHHLGGGSVVDLFAEADHWLGVAALLARGDHRVAVLVGQADGERRATRSAGAAPARD